MNSLILSLALLSQSCTTSSTGVTTCRTGGLLSGIFGSRSTTAFSGTGIGMMGTGMMGTGMMGTGMMGTGMMGAYAPSTSYVVPSTSYVVPSTSYVIPSTSYIVPSNTLESVEVVMGYHKVKHQGVVLTVYGFRNSKGMIEWEPDHPHNKKQLIYKTILAERIDN